MKKILLTTDFSDNAKNSILYAIEMFGINNVTYSILNAYSEPKGSANVMVSLNEILKEESEKGLGELKNELTQEFGNDLSVNLVSKYGSVTNVIGKLSDNDNYDYVVIGAKGAGALESFFMGSNTLKVVQSVSCPILVVPNEEKYSGVSRIALAADYEQFKHAHLLNGLKELATDKDAEVMVVNVQSERTAADYDHALGGFELHNVLEGVKHSFHSETNSSIVKGLESFMKQNDVNILTLVARHHNFFDRIFHKSVTKEFSQLAEVPLLVLHE